MSIIGKKQLRRGLHVSDDEALLFADGELPPKRHAEIQKHLDACWECRTHLLDLQNTIAGFIHFQHERFDGVMPPVAQPLTQLRLRLQEEISSSTRPRKASWLSGRVLVPVLAGLATLCVLFFSASLLRFSSRSGLPDSNVFAAAKPIASLTPGETVRVSVQQVCSGSGGEAEPPEHLRKLVFVAYGLRDVRENEFQVDYLITPDLGGAQSLNNLWPEPYYNTAWNARVKDRLEERLRDLVCGGHLDLKTAQRELSSDWIAAYKRYFQSDTPVARFKVANYFFASLKAPEE